VGASDLKPGGGLPRTNDRYSRKCLQESLTLMNAFSNRRLERLPAQGKVAGVCAGIAVYLETDVALVRAVWVLLSVVPGALIGGVIAYGAAWALMPVSHVAAPPAGAKRVVRPQGDRKIAGVCAGLARYFDLDVTAVRLIWVVLSIYPGAIIVGVVAYAIAWFVIPSEPRLPIHTATQPL
jgi:phage shock protein PspC (stress-responsive transcriptional regulator)